MTKAREAAARRAPVQPPPQAASPDVRSALQRSAHRPGESRPRADAVDGAFATIYGEATLSHFEVWAYQVNPRQVSLDDPVDLSQRLDGAVTVRLD